MIFLNWIGWSSRSHQFGYHKKVGKFFRLKNWNQCRNCFPVTFLYDSFLSLVFFFFFFIRHYWTRCISLWAPMKFYYYKFLCQIIQLAKFNLAKFILFIYFLKLTFQTSYIYIFVCRFFRLTIRVQWEEIVKGELTAFMTSVGRMKFCRPLYQWVDVFLILFICESKLLWFWKLLLNTIISEF